MGGLYVRSMADIGRQNEVKFHPIPFLSIPCHFHFDQENGYWHGKYYSTLNLLQWKVEWNGMESGKENFTCVLWNVKNNGIESGMEMEWNNLKQCFFSGME